MLLLSIATGICADKDAPVFKIEPAASYPHHQTISKLTIAADAYATREETQLAFGKLDPSKYGILPVLVVMENDSGESLKLSGMRVEYLRTDRRSIEPIPPDEVRYLSGVNRPKMTGTPSPLPIPGLGKKKDPLEGHEIEGRAFSAPMLPPGDSASGFFYFNTAAHRDSMLYIRGIVEAATGQELFFFEIPLE